MDTIILVVLLEYMTKSIVQRTKSLIDYGQYKSLRKVATLNNVSKSAVSLWVREAYGLDRSH